MKIILETLSIAAYNKIYSISDSNSRPPKDREFLTSIPTKSEVVHLVTTMPHYLLQIICLRHHQPNTLAFPINTWSVHILCYWTDMFMLYFVTNQFIMEIKKPKKKKKS